MNEVLPAGTVRHAFRFEGDAREYFGIWIVNLFLTMITLGLYSPWAKVRKKRYFYGNTWVAGANFDYHGDPVSILKGRLLAFAAFAAYTVVSEFYPRAAYGVLLAAIAASPWLIQRTLRFNAVNSSYRNLRFHFHGGLRDAAVAVWPLALWPILGLLLGADGDVPRTAWHWFALIVPGLAFAASYPRVVGALKRYSVGNAAFGDARFGIDLPYSEMYVIYIAAGIAAFLGLFAIGAVVGLVAIGSPKIGVGLFWLAYLGGIAAFLAYTRSRVANVVFGGTRMAGGVRFVSTLAAGKLAKIYFVNLLAVACTFGLAVPWAVVRTAHYRAEQLALESDGDLDDVLAAIARPVSAAGDQLGEMFDVDLSL
ncbi:hypothetical protein BWI17_01005 [Betaproteobacteria bacterium GR16-43]|nr:hypothetical protein BWI17_01005 [Betaproteobacteria bacterium GR16-43]